MNAVSTETYQYKMYTDIYGVCIDWETSGADFKSKTVLEQTQKYQGISLGVVVFRLDTFEPVDTLYLLRKFDDTRYQWQDAAERVHGLSREYLAANGGDDVTVITQLFDFLSRYVNIRKNIILLGHNTDYDYWYLYQLLAPHGVMPDISRTRLDTSCMGVIGFGLHRSEDIFRCLGMPPRTQHNALEDSLYTVKSAQIMRQIMQMGVAQYNQQLQQGMR